MKNFVNWFTFCKICEQFCNGVLILSHSVVWYQFCLTLVTATSGRNIAIFRTSSTFLILIKRKEYVMNNGVARISEYWRSNHFSRHKLMMSKKRSSSEALQSLHFTRYNTIPPLPSTAHRADPAQIGGWTPMAHVATPVIMDHFNSQC